MVNTTNFHSLCGGERGEPFPHKRARPVQQLKSVHRGPSLGSYVKQSPGLRAREGGSRASRRRPPAHGSSSPPPTGPPSGPGEQERATTGSRRQEVLWQSNYHNPETRSYRAPGDAQGITIFEIRTLASAICALGLPIRTLGEPNARVAKPGIRIGKARALFAKPRGRIRKQNARFAKPRERIATFKYFCFRLGCLGGGWRLP